MVLLWILALTIITYLLYYKLSRRQYKDQPFIEYGWIPYFGVFPRLMIYKEKYLMELKRKHGDIFTLYYFGNYHHVIFDEASLKIFYTNSTHLGFYEYVFDLLGIFFPNKQKAYLSLNFIKFIHKFTISKENSTYFIDTQKRLSAELINKWKKEGKVDLLSDFSKFIAKLNLEQFIGYSSEELVDDLLDTDAANILENRPIITLFKSYFGIKRQEDQKYENITNVIAKQIEKRQKDLNSKKIPFDELIHHCIENEEHFSVDSVVSRLWGMFFGAQVNTTMLLFWSVYRLMNSKDDELIDVKYEILNAPEDYGFEYIQEMKMTDKYLYEIFRIYYYGFPSGRKINQDIEMNGYTLKKGSYLFNPVLSKIAYEEVDNSHEINLDQKKIDSSYKFVPFGSGIHPCVGKTFAMTEVKSLLIQFYKNIQMKSVKDISQNDLTGFDWNRPKHGKSIFEVLKK